MQIVGVLALAWFLVGILADCNVCQTNQVACINSTSFYLCFGDGTPHTDHIYSCLEGTVCTDRTAICLQASAQRPPSCGDTSKCGQCSANRNYKFACQSRRLFQMCYGATQPTGALGTCPAGYVCDASTDVVCVAERAGQNYTCDLNDDLVSSPTEDTTVATTVATTAKPTTPSSLTAQQVCELRAKSGLYETVPRDPNCKRYISCYFATSGKIIAVEYDCTASSYFEAEKERCSYLLPANCTA
ncbi:uncharacterized protein LOC115771222 [Drosophila novamexicana]|uniref:uncharacterized protein LOC115771222 n=1 Tax=Drosophila novamexicana TaxID=47314 RepID=UPI0011E5C65A|nr:uncharacterized protein LOC115771222 [Drosophila novamexicana]